MTLKKYYSLILMLSDQYILINENNGAYVNTNKIKLFSSRTNEWNLELF